MKGLKKLGEIKEALISMINSEIEELKTEWEKMFEDSINS
jgi:hypothetical protein